MGVSIGRSAAESRLHGVTASYAPAPTHGCHLSLRYGYHCYRCRYRPHMVHLQVIDHDL